MVSGTEQIPGEAVDGAVAGVVYLIRHLHAHMLGFLVSVLFSLPAAFIIYRNIHSQTHRVPAAPLHTERDTHFPSSPPCLLRLFTLEACLCLPPFELVSSCPVKQLVFPFVHGFLLD